MSVPALSIESLQGLAGKYRTLLHLRREKSRTGQTAGRLELRSLAREFPGALRELEALTLEELERRALALERAAAGAGPIEPWMLWMSEYHALLRAALRLKLLVRRRDDLTDEAARALGAGLDPPFEPELVRSIARPPDGRLGTVVLAELARRHGVSVDELRRAILPPRLGEAPGQ